MSELRAPKAPHPMDAPKAPAAPTAAPKAPKAPISAAKASKATKATTAAPVAAHTTAKGDTAQCQVLTAKGQCSNPSRHPYKGGWTCTTHGKRISQGKAYRLAPKVKAYDPTLWGGTAPKATAKA